MIFQNGSTRATERTSWFWAPMVIFVFTTKFSIVNINQDAVFLDLGANLGIYSLLAAQLRHSASDHRCFLTLLVSYHWHWIIYLFSSKLVNPNTMKSSVSIYHYVQKKLHRPQSTSQIVFFGQAFSIKG